MEEGMTDSEEDDLTFQQVGFSYQQVLNSLFGHTNLRKTPLVNLLPVLKAVKRSMNSFRPPGLMVHYHLKQHRLHKRVTSENLAVESMLFRYSFCSIALIVFSLSLRSNLRSSFLPEDPTMRTPQIHDSDCGHVQGELPKGSQKWGDGGSEF